VGTRWYQSRTVVASAIGGLALVLAAIIAGAFAHFDRDRYPPIEIKNLTPTGEEVLARLALAPARQLMDSSAFAAIKSNDLIWNDTLGVAIAKPNSYEWGVGTFDSVGTITLGDVGVLRWFGSLLIRSFPDDSLKGKLPLFGIRLDEPTRVLLNEQTRIDSTAIGVNPFRDPKYFLGFVRVSMGEAELNKMPFDSLLLGERDAIRTVDSVLKATMPTERKIFSGVYVGRVTKANVPRLTLYDWIKHPLLDDAVAPILLSSGLSNFEIVDRDRGTVLFSDAIRIEGAAVNGKAIGSITLNRAGYAIQAGDAVDIVFLQYTSAQPKKVLDELQRFLESVKLRVTQRGEAQTIPAFKVPIPAKTH
jgi:hypothetical protein